MSYVLHESEGAGLGVWIPFLVWTLNVAPQYMFDIFQ